MSESDPSGGGGGEKPPGKPLIDLPLRGEPPRAAPPSPRPPSPAQPPPQSPAPPPTPSSEPPRYAAAQPRTPPPRKRRGGPLWIVAVLLLLAAAAAWYFLRPAPPRAAFAPTAVDFGQQLLGEVSESVTVTVANTGEQPLRVNAVTLDSEAFQVVAESCTEGERLPGESCEIELAFAPQAAEVDRGELHLDGNLAWGSGALPLSGIGIAPRPVLEPAAVAFSPQTVDERSEETLVRIANAGSAPLTLGAIGLDGDHAEDFSLEERCAGITLGIEERCAVRVAFVPRAAGDRRASLAVETDAPGEPVRVPLEGVGVWTGPAFTAEQPTLDFGNQRVGQTASARSLRIVNRTAMPRPSPSVNAPAPGSGFTVRSGSCAGATVAPGEGCAIEASFTPAAVGEAVARFEVRDGDGPPVQIELRGVGVAPKLAVDRPRLDFGSARVGTRTAELALTVSNSGSARLRVAGSSIGGPGADPFLIARDSCAGKELAPGERCRIEVTFNPKASGPHRAGLEIRSDSSSGTEQVALIGEGTESALAIEPGNLDFGTVITGENGELELEISNQGNAPLEVRGLRTTGGDAADFQVSSIGCRLDQGLEPRRGCRIAVRFSPSAAGPRSARLEVAYDGRESPGGVPLFGTGARPLPGFRVAPEGVDFGGLAVGERSGIRTLTIRNPGKGELVLRELRLSGADAGDFQIVPGSCEGAPAIASGADCTVGVRFVPRAAGSRGAALEIRHNAPGGRARVTLTGRASGAAP